jgi:hypothetical protein
MNPVDYGLIIQKEEWEQAYFVRKFSSFNFRGYKVEITPDAVLPNYSSMQECVSLPLDGLVLRMADKRI